jgi:acyl-CoA thioesterase FadM/3-hydroxymyristoyl/3-hydroxydecanoyl-(acyl carrier protein) dehydratase
MPGNAWYGFSNEALNLIMRRFEADHPGTQTISIAYSIWRDEGMGARMGSVERLKGIGIDAIPTEEGVKRFVRLFLTDPGVHQVIVTSRLGGFDTWSPEVLPVPEKARYLDKLLHATPGVESLFQAHLTLEHDPYLKDHLFHDSYLLPAVFGLEAMAQAVAHVTGESDFSLSRVRIEEIKLKRPITVDPETGADMVVWAEAQEDEPGAAPRVVRAGVSKSHTGVKSDFFSATFVLGLEDKPPEHVIAIPNEPLDIRPKLDLYREKLLFQGPSFQRIHQVWTISAMNEKAENAIFSTKIHDLAHVAEEAFPEPSHQAMFLGDAFFRDSLLQSAQLLVPKKTCLPVYIRCLDIYPWTEREPASIVTAVQLNRMEELETEYTVIAVNSDGHVKEKLEGYTVRSVTRYDDNPTAAELALPDERDNRIVSQALNRLSDSLALKIPRVLLRYLPGLHDLSREERHARELPLLREVILKATEKYPDVPKTCDIEWLDSGKPVVAGLEENQIGISLSHDERLCVCVAGAGPQGCDVAPITNRSRQEWTGLLGQSRDHLLDALIDDPDTLDRAGTRVWSAMEALHKVREKTGALLEIIHKENDAIVFQGTTDNGPIRILTLPMDLTRGPERILALVVQEGCSPAAGRPSSDCSGYEDLFETRHFEFIDGAPQGQGFFIQRLPVTFRPNSQLSRTVYFSNYLFWLGEIREASVWPVLGEVATQFSTGKWGVVTNNSLINILGEATAHDQIEIRLWASGNSGPANSTMDLTYDFRKMLNDGRYERLAWCEQQVTWVRILDHGIVKPEPYPDYYWDLLKNMLPRYDAPNVPEPLPEPLADLKQAQGDEDEYRAPSGPVVRPLLHEQTIETSLDNSNIVGNIYFANYYAWQGQTRDRYFFNLIPEYFRGAGEKGELLCLECRVDHLREAMPFDRILVTMSLKALKTYSVVLYFEYFRLDPDGTRVKLAFGEHHAVWVVRDSQGKPAPAPFPPKVQDAFRRAIAA